MGRIRKLLSRTVSIIKVEEMTEEKNCGFTLSKPALIQVRIIDTKATG